MAKRFKLRFTFPSFQFCRLKHFSSLPRPPSPSPSPATYYRFSPFNPKAFDIGYPNIPEPPPSTPNYPLFKRHVSSPIPVDCGCRSRSFECKTKSLRYKQPKTRRKLFNSSVSDPYYCDTWPIRLPRSEKKRKKKKARVSVCISTSSAESGWFSTDGSDYNEETESLVLSSRSFDSSSDFDCPLEIISERPINECRRKKNKKKKKKKKNLKVRRLKRYPSWESWRGGERTTTPESVSPARASVLRRLMVPCAVEGMVKESFAVVKRSEDPHEDFKGSMLEMILEKHMFDAKDLEQLLMCFLSLNSPHHHAAIVEAFVEVWEVLFCKSKTPKSQRVLMDH